MSIHEASREIAFCAHTINYRSPLIIPDTKKDKRFFDNPMVVGKPHIRFYAGVSLTGPDGRNIGAFCIKDTKPRKLSKNELQILQFLAAWAEQELNSLELSKALLNVKYQRWKLRKQSGKLEKALKKIKTLHALLRKKR